MQFGIASTKQLMPKGFNILHFGFGILALLVMNYMYSRYKAKQDKTYIDKELDIIREYLLSNDSRAEATAEDLKHSTQPILWIPMVYETNARNWLSHGSRNTTDLNQPYIILCIQSIINKCNQSFKICIIDDTSYLKLIEGSSSICDLPEPARTHARNSAQIRLLYTYGGMIVPPSFTCSRDLIGLWDMGTKHADAFVCENQNRNVTHEVKRFMCDHNFMGATKGSNVMRHMCEWYDTRIGNDFSAHTDFSGHLNRWCNEQVTKNQMTLIDGMLVGTKTTSGSLIDVNDLCGLNHINFLPDAYGIWLPQKDFINRTKHAYFPRMSAKQILSCDLIVAKHITLNVASFNKDDADEVNMNYEPKHDMRIDDDESSSDESDVVNEVPEEYLKGRLTKIPKHQS